MTYLAYIVTIVAVVVAGIFALLLQVWTGFAYFVLTTLLLLSLFWAGWLIYQYFTSFQKELDKKFAFFKADQINKSKTTVEYFERNLPIFKKEFSRKVVKDKIIKWFIILFCFACAVAFLMGMIFY